MSSSTSTIVAGDTTWVLISAALVMLMIPGLGYFYSGLARHKNALSLLFLSALSLAVVSIQWFVCGFSLAFSPQGGQFIGTLNQAFFIGFFDGTMETYPSIPNIPTSVFAVYQGFFAAITPALALGSAAERLRILPSIVFLFLWSTLVYDVIAYWNWAPGGWLRLLGSLDFAGGTPVHIASGAAGLALSYVLKRRHGYGTEHFKPHNLSSVFLGTALLWFGWFGFNGGSELSANTRASLAFINTNLSACAGALTWVIIEYRTTRKYSAFAFCSGAVAGLVTVTPACGFVPVWSSIIFGFMGSLCCNLFLHFKASYGFDDALDVFGIHGVGGLVGNLLTGIFASKRMVALNGAVIEGGWIDGNFKQFGIQLAGCVTGFVWSFVVTFLICTVMDYLPYLNMRLSVDDELIGTDHSQLGEGAYDYIEVAVGEENGRRATANNLKLNEKLLLTKQQDLEMTRLKQDSDVNLPNSIKASD